jgi:hypothetical protein
MKTTCSGLHRLAKFSLSAHGAIALIACGSTPPAAPIIANPILMLVNSLTDPGKYSRFSFDGFWFGAFAFEP